MSGALVALTLVALAFAPGASEPASAIPEPIECFTGIDGSTICDVRVAGCKTTIVVGPNGASVSPPEC